MSKSTPPPVFATAVPATSVSAPSLPAYPVPGQTSHFADLVAAARLDEEAARRFLGSHSWPAGLQETLLRGLRAAPLRFFLLDDSGSMVIEDGHRVLAAGTRSVTVSCSRWAELGESVNFFAGLASAARAATEFRFLNREEPLLVGANTADSEANLRRLLAALQLPPSGGTPLCYHIAEIVERVRSVEHVLRRLGQRAVVVIATDGEPSDGDMARAMKALERLPVWVVVRLCTDNSDVTEFWNQVDADLELDLDVLDDLAGEAAEVAGHNPWLTYAQPMHRLREFGVPLRELDLLDERRLGVEEMRTVLADMYRSSSMKLSLNSVRFGGSSESFPHPDLGWDSFEDSVRLANAREGRVWNPHLRKPADWVSVTLLRHAYGPKDVCSKCSLS